MSDWIQTYTGKKFYLGNDSLDSLDDICIGDIAHALSQICRYNGHSQRFYSVAEHSVLVSYACPEEHALWGLMHDASEAYLTDIPRPFKSMIANYRTLEANVMARIVKRFDIPGAIEPKEVKSADTAMLYFEAKTLMRDGGISWDNMKDYENEFFRADSDEQSVYTRLMKCPYVLRVANGTHQWGAIPCWSPAEAEHKFLARFLELKGY